MKNQRLYFARWLVVYHYLRNRFPSWRRPECIKQWISAFAGMTGGSGRSGYPHQLKTEYLRLRPTETRPYNKRC
jgi:hypothetical protein